MPWPDIFFRSRKRREEQVPPAKATPSPSQTVAIKTNAVSPVEPAPAKVEAPERTKSHLPADKPALRPAVYATKPVETTKPATVPPASTEAESLRAFAKANSIRLAKRPQAEPQSPHTGPILTTAKTAAAQTVPRVIPEATPSTEPAPASPAAEGPLPVKETPPPETSKAAPSPEATKPPVAEIPPEAAESTPESKAPQAPISEPAPASPAPASTTRAKRRMKLTDLARMIFSPAPMEPPPAPEPQSAVSPPAFTVPVPIGGATLSDSPTKAPETPVIEVPKEEKAPAEAKSAETNPAPAPDARETEEAKIPSAPASPEPEQKAETSAPEKASEPPSSTSTTGPAPVPPGEGETNGPKPDKPETPNNSVPVESTLAKTMEKKEFLLVNGERILGAVLSETPESIYLDHGTLGVLTLPRSQIAQRPIEIILINGDRIVGDIMAETPDTLYVRHASLGMLTVPRSQRSTRVIEAILKDGDRILGEVLAETENFTVIRSATLGTVAVPHNKVAMLNRKIEQIELKAVSTPSPSLADRPPA